MNTKAVHEESVLSTQQANVHLPSIQGIPGLCYSEAAKWCISVSREGVAIGEKELFAVVVRSQRREICGA